MHAAEPIRIAPPRSQRIMNRALLLTIVGAISLVWGVADLRRKDGKRNAYATAQSWAQVVAGIIAVGFSLLHWGY
jgi:hypothetical protein